MLMKLPTKQHLWAVPKFIFKGSEIVCCWLLTWAKWEDFHADLHRDLYRKEKHDWEKQDEVGLQLVPGGNSDYKQVFGFWEGAQWCFSLPWAHPGVWAWGLEPFAVEAAADVNSGVCHETEMSLITLWGLSVGLFFVFPELYCSLYRMLQILAAIRCYQYECRLWIRARFKALVRTDICEPAELDILCICTITSFFCGRFRDWNNQSFNFISYHQGLCCVCVLSCMPNQKFYLGAILSCSFKSRLMLLSSGLAGRWIFLFMWTSYEQLWKEEQQFS